MGSARRGARTSLRAPSGDCRHHEFEIEELEVDMDHGHIFLVFRRNTQSSKWWGQRGECARDSRGITESAQATLGWRVGGGRVWCAYGGGSSDGRGEQEVYSGLMRRRSEGLNNWTSSSRLRENIFGTAELRWPAFLALEENTLWDVQEGCPARPQQANRRGTRFGTLSL
jgi:hypothetical protein